MLILDPSTTINAIAESIVGNPHLDRVEIQIALGSLLGDGHVAKPNNCRNATCYFIEGHSGAQVEYLKWKHQFLMPLSRGWKLIAPRRKKGSYFQLRSKSEPFWNQLHNWFYTGKTKIVTRSILNRLNELGLAVWFMDDGTFVKHYTSRYFRLATHNFTKAENELIQRWFKVRWGITCRIATETRKGVIYHFLYFSSRPAQQLLLIIGHYIHPCMGYKADMLFRKGQTVELSNARYPHLSQRTHVVLAEGNDIVCSNRKLLEVGGNVQPTTEW